MLFENLVSYNLFGLLCFSHFLHILLLNETMGIGALAPVILPFWRFHDRRKGWGRQTNKKKHQDGLQHQRHHDIHNSAPVSWPTTKRSISASGIPCWSFCDWKKNKKQYCPHCLVILLLLLLHHNIFHQFRVML